MKSLFGGSTRASSGKDRRKPIQKSLGLRRFLPESEDATLRVLDLGPARSANLEFFSRYGGRLTVADFYNGLRAARAATAATVGDDVDDNRKAKAFAELLPFDKSARFDLILAWDLLNYLTPLEQHLLMASLEPFCLSGTVILAFVSTQKEMPPGPSAYSIRDADTLVYEEREGRARPCPRYLEGDLLKRMQGLTVENRYQLRNGMLEYVFSYRLTSRPAASTSSSGEVLRYRLEPTHRWSSTPSR
ncbi:MAG: hypothetical protein BMS9Abin37_3105 [Acidobacteriota bacterium]|nr:MAG: hypothetical protein BMS9Abin37_3105 [Acidobacteriota bacterium]